MKPRYLEFKGINSFCDKVEINFDKLLQSGIFGIFGDTGSGKSTILDSIIFALYGEVDRKVQTNAEIINTKLDRAYVIYEFEISIDNTRKIYRVEREISKTSSQKVKLFEKKDNQLVGICDGISKVEDEIINIIGLKCVEFKKCIALPQGEFSAFVKSTKGERLSLIARLFDLENYGLFLNSKIRKRKEIIDRENNLLIGEMRSYEGYSKEQIGEYEQKIKELEKNKDTFNEELTQTQKKYDKMKTDFENKKKLDSLQKEFLEMKKQEAVKKSLRANIDRLSFAKEVISLDKEVEEYKAQEADAQKKKIEINLQKEKSAKEKEEFEKNNLSKQHEEELSKYNTLLGKLEGINADVPRYKRLREQRKVLLANYSKQKREFQEYEKKLQIKEAELNVIDAKIKVLLENKDFEELEVNLTCGVLRKEYQKSSLYFKDCKEKINDFDKTTALYKAVSNEIDLKIAEYDALINELGEKDIDVNLLIKKVKENREELDKIQREFNDKKVEIEKLKSVISNVNEKLEDILLKGNETKSELEEIERKILNSLQQESINFESIDLERFITKKIADTKIEIEKVKSTQQKYNKQRESLKDAFDESDKSLNQICAQIFQVGLSRQKSEAKLKKLLVEQSFNDVAQAKELEKELEGNTLKKEELDNFFAELLNLEKQIALLKDYEKVTVDEQEVKNFAQKLDIVSTSLKEVEKELAVINNNLKIAQDGYAKKIIKESELKIVEDKKKNIEKLESLCRGNKFMEFIADEYLSSISTSASTLLLELTNGKYFIKYENGFFVGDNHAGGQLRAVKTLSGGETFLVSLSLALSLSSAIFEKSLRPIEFFFLDEGFGSLDSKLVDVVMDSLERLKNKNFSIGLISHIEELKNRIPCRIEVTSATETTGSKVRLQC